MTDLAAESTPGIAAMDADWAARVIAGEARDANELRGWLMMLGLISAPPAWSTEGRRS